MARAVAFELVGGGESEVVEVGWAVRWVGVSSSQFAARIEAVVTRVKRRAAVTLDPPEIVNVKIILESRRIHRSSADLCFFAFLD